MIVGLFRILHLKIGPFFAERVFRKAKGLATNSSESSWKIEEPAEPGTDKSSSLLLLAFLPNIHFIGEDTRDPNVGEGELDREDGFMTLLQLQAVREPKRTRACAGLVLVY